jgi:hypothetical protein
MHERVSDRIPVQRRSRVERAWRRARSALRHPLTTRIGFLRDTRRAIRVAALIERIGQAVAGNGDIRVVTLVDEEGLTRWHETEPM